jgi:hypothetical protein
VVTRFIVICYGQILYLPAKTNLYDTFLLYFLIYS